jgi:hypothetical protein
MMIMNNKQYRYWAHTTGIIPLDTTTPELLEIEWLPEVRSAQTMRNLRRIERRVARRKARKLKRIDK